MNKLLVGNKSDLPSKKVVEYSAAKVRSPFDLGRARVDGNHVPLGIRGPARHPFLGDLG